MAPKGNSLPLVKKLEIISAIEQEEKSGKKPNFTSIGRQLNLDRTTISRLSKCREEIKRQAYRFNGNLARKRKRKLKEEDVDAALLLWFKQKLDQNAQVINLPVLKEKAIELAQQLGHEFVPTDSWLKRFKDRYGLKVKREYNGKQAADCEAAEDFRIHRIKDILEKYSADNIFNADETGIYVRGLPDRGYAPNEEMLNVGKKAMERITVLVCANMSGSEKLKLLVIGKSQRPGVFPTDLSSLPVTFKCSRNAWMTGGIFFSFLHHWNEKLVAKDRKILLLLDNCSAHPSDVNLSNIDVIFLPPTTTSTVQPMDMGIIRSLKAHYRSILNKRIIQALDIDETRKAADAMKAISLLDAIYMLDKSWQAVTATTIKNCFAKAGFVNKGSEDVGEETVAFPVPVPDNFTPEEFDELVDQDKDLEVCGTLTDVELLDVVKRQKLEEDEEDSDGEDGEPSCLKTSNILTSLKTVRKYLQFKGEQNVLSQFEEVEEHIMNDIHQVKKQQRINSLINRLQAKAKLKMIEPL